MFVSIKNIVTLLNIEIGYVRNAIDSGKATPEYLDEMKSHCEAKIAYLTKNSCNKKLVAKCARLVASTFGEV